MTSTTYTPQSSSADSLTLKRQPKGLNYIIWFGSPGPYDPNDKRHDQAWYNYLNPILRIAEAGKLDIKQNDQMFWCLYAAGYKKRWETDNKSDRQFIREHVAKVKSSGAVDYIDRVKKRAEEFSKKFNITIKVKEFNEGQAYWEDLKSYPDKSIASVWYFGHGRKDLWLEITHTQDTHSAALPTDPLGRNSISYIDIPAQSIDIKPKYYSKGIASKFYGCNTKKFAELWSVNMGVLSEGADGTMDFGIWENDVTKILNTLEKGIKPDSIGQEGKWVQFLF